MEPTNNQEYSGAQQAYNFEGGIEMIPIGDHTLINELMPSQSKPCPSDLVKKSATSDIPLKVE